MSAGALLQQTAPTARHALRTAVAGAVGGDDLVADLVLLSLISAVYARVPFRSIGEREERECVCMCVCACVRSLATCLPSLLLSPNALSLSLSPCCLPPSPLSLPFLSLRSHTRTRDGSLTLGHLPVNIYGVTGDAAALPAM